MNMPRQIVSLAAAAVVAALPLLGQDPADKSAPKAPVEAPVKFVPGTPMPGTTGLKQGQAPSRRPGNAWFPVVDQDLGTVVGEDHVTALFKFKNPTQAAIQWTNLQGSCQCSKSVIRVGDRTFQHQTKPRPQILQVSKDASGKEVREEVQQITVGPGEEGEVEVHMEMQGVTGPRQASLDIHGSDAETPHTKLSWVATGAKLLVVSPQEVNLNQMTWNDVREFEVTVTSPIYKDFNILRMDEAKDFDVKWEKSMQGEQAVWTIKGKYGPLGEESGSGGSLKFYTDLRGESSFLLRVVAFVQGPLDVKPGGFLPLGRVPKGKGMVKEVVFQPNDGTKLAATALRFESLSVDKDFVTVSQRQDGANLVVTLEIKDSAPVGMLKGELVVELNHPVVKEKRVLFNGWVR